MARLAVLVIAALATWGTWFALVYVTRHAGVDAVQELTFWISPLALSGWILGIALLILYYKLFGRIWHSLKVSSRA